jgi:hypothetical protein
VSRTVALTGRIENLLDEQYELAHTFNTPDRGVYLSVSYAPASRATATVAAQRPRDPGGAPGAYFASVNR